MSAMQPGRALAAATWTAAERRVAFEGTLSYCLGRRQTPNAANAARLAENAAALSSEAAAEAAQQAPERAAPGIDEPDSSECGCETA